MRRPAPSLLAMRLGVSLACAFVPLVTSCKGPTVVEPAKQCADPCCGGSPLNVDCALHGNLRCTEDADLCVARAYGCADGSYFLDEPPKLSTTCVGDATDELPFLLLEPQDAAGASTSEVAPDDGTADQAPDGAGD